MSREAKIVDPTTGDTVEVEVSSGVILSVRPVRATKDVMIRLTLADAEALARVLLAFVATDRADA